VLLACPQLLSDDVRTASGESALDWGHPACTRPVCQTEQVDASAPSPGFSADTGADPFDAGDDTGPTTPEPRQEDAAPVEQEPPAWWLVALNDRTHIASNNCLGISGWNDGVSDSSSGSSVAETFQDGSVCLSGRVGASGWGVVFNLTLNAEAIWDATARGVGGFAFDFTGSALPPQVEVVYTEAGDDYCRAVVPTSGVEVPFDTAHPGCSTSSSSVPDPSRLTYIRMHLPATGAAYDFDFCVQLRAIP